jgi:hypothetical protein
MPSNTHLLITVPEYQRSEIDVFSSLIDPGKQFNQLPRDNRLMLYSTGPLNHSYYIQYFDKRVDFARRFL